MANITTCLSCSKLYEAESEELANSPSKDDRMCPRCILLSLRQQREEVFAQWHALQFNSVHEARQLWDRLMEIDAKYHRLMISYPGITIEERSHV